MKLTWYGHSAFRIESGAAVVLIDPFLSGNPKWNPPVRFRWRMASQMVRCSIAKRGFISRGIIHARHQHPRGKD